LECASLERHPTGAETAIPPTTNLKPKEREETAEVGEAPRTKCQKMGGTTAGQGGKATLAAAPDADILPEIVCLLTPAHTCACIHISGTYISRSDGAQRGVGSVC